MDEPRCPDASTKYFEVTVCNLNDKMCVRESGWDCPYYNEWLEELKKEEEDKYKELLSYWD